jgi:hypothetical protein
MHLHFKLRSNSIFFVFVQGSDPEPDQKRIWIRNKSFQIHNVDAKTTFDP